MGGSDFYCSLSGTRYFCGTDEFRDTILVILEESGESEDSVDEEPEGEDSADADPEGDEDENEVESVGMRSGKGLLSEALMDGLVFAEEDVESSSTFVMICPYTRLDDGQIVMHADFEDPSCPTEITDSNIMEVFNVIPGDNPDLGDYCNGDPNVQDNYSVLPHGTTMIITYTSYLVLKQACPDLKPHIIYRLAYDNNPGFNGKLEEIDYGPMGGVMEQYANWGKICGIDDYDESGQWWKRLLTQDGRTDEEILRDAWRGPGNMWVFVRPDRFPIAETLEATALSSFQNNLENNPYGPPTLHSLPLDVLLAVCEYLPIQSTHMLISSDRCLRTQLLPHADSIAHQHIIMNEPHLLPAGPFDFSDKKYGKGRGREEADWWTAQWAGGGISGLDMDAKIPWLLYRRECSRSMSMWNRERIWGVAKQMEKLAKERGLLL